MNFTFSEADTQRLREQMRQEGNDLIAKRIQADVAKSRHFTGAVFIAQVGQIDQHEWDKWRMT